MGLQDLRLSGLWVEGFGVLGLGFYSLEFEIQDRVGVGLLYSGKEDRALRVD